MLGLYLHIPFCVKKCAYCDFVSVEGNAKQDAYVSALCKEIELTGNMYGKAVDSIFIGGGTPSVLPARKLVEVLNRVKICFAVTEDAEITMEANPCSISAEKLELWKKAGVNRLSIGLQAAQDTHLQALGRVHTVDAFDRAFNDARKAGFENINIDVIYALPMQTLSEWEQTLFYVLYKKPEHISAYALKIEENTPMGQMQRRGELLAADEDSDLAMYHMAQDILGYRGFENYEISNFSIPGDECRHNLKYWNLRDYLGLGVAAHSCIDRLRFANTSDLDLYIKNMTEGKMQYEQSEFISDEESKLEYFMLKLRLKRGFMLYDYKNRFGEDFLDVFKKEFETAEREGLAKLKDDCIVPTARGFDLQNRLVGILIQNL
ncbi:MAG: radical SAM family heme chaperone HemW [Christensenella sp.]|nr:radical SAM family heme chaperone HemW [Christensenella sp.]